MSLVWPPVQDLVVVGLGAVLAFAGWPVYRFSYSLLGILVGFGGAGVLAPGLLRGRVGEEVYGLILAAVILALGAVTWWLFERARKVFLFLLGGLLGLLVSRGIEGMTSTSPEMLVAKMYLEGGWGIRELLFALGGGVGLLFLERPVIILGTAGLGASILASHFGTVYVFLLAAGLGLLTQVRLSRWTTR